jgi:hypothetical protein
MKGMSPKPLVLGIVIMTGALLSALGAAAQDLCENGSPPQAVAVRVSGYKPPSDAGSLDVRIAGIPLKLGTGPKPGNQEVVFGFEFNRRRHMDEFRAQRLDIPCRASSLIDGPRPELVGGICWAVLKYDAGDNTCWHLKVEGTPSTPPFSVYIGRSARKPHSEAAQSGWNIERDLPRTEYVQIKIHPLDELVDDDKAQLPPLFETGPKEIGEGKVPKTIDCKDILERMIQWQKACQVSCESDAIDRYLKPYLGNPPRPPRGEGKSAAGEALAIRKAWLQNAEEIWKGECLLPLKSLTFESTK